jgi:hypothetical protein
VIPEMDRVEQQPQLDVLNRVGHEWRYLFGIQTRTRDSSFSTSSGLAM